MFAKNLLLIAVLGSTLAAAQEISVEKVEGQSRFVIESAAVTDLSGIAWTGGDSFYAVADHPRRLVPIALRIDPASGRILRGELGTAIPVASAASDFEGLAYVTATRTFYISAESKSAVVRVSPGGALRELAVPPIFSLFRQNLGLESIAASESGKQFWVANEEALDPDGPTSGAVGTVVRLQQLDADWRPVAQFAWRTEPAAFRFRGSGNGVADLCLLPNGRLLVLERGFGFAGLQMRLFVADFKGATDITKVASLAGANFSVARKILLHEEATGFTNFEGLTLGPRLADGARSLIVIADSNGGPGHTFLPLKIRFGAR